MRYLGDFPEDATVSLPFTTNDAAGGAVAPSTAFEAADLLIYKGSGATQKATVNGITMTSPFDTVTGLHMLAIDTSVDTGDIGFWQVGNDYHLVLSPDETVDSQTIVAVLATFSIENRTTFPKADMPANFSDLAVTATTGRVDVSLIEGVDATNQINAACDLALADYNGPTHTELIAEINDVQADIAALNNISVTDITGATIENSLSLLQVLRLLLAASAGKLSGAATTSVAIRDTADTKDRISATVDADGNRTAVTLDAT